MRLSFSLSYCPSSLSLERHVQIKHALCSLKHHPDLVPPKMLTCFAFCVVITNDFFLTPEFHPFLAGSTWHFISKILFFCVYQLITGMNSWLLFFSNIFSLINALKVIFVIKLSHIWSEASNWFQYCWDTALSSFP